MELQIELSRRGIPFVITSGMRFFEQAHVKDLVAQLRFVVTRKIQPAFLSIRMPFPKVGEKTAAKLIILAEKLCSRKVRVDALISTRGNIQKFPADAKEDWIGLVETLKVLQTYGNRNTSTKL